MPHGRWRHISAAARARHRVQLWRAQTLIFTLQSHPISGWLFYLPLTWGREGEDVGILALTSVAVIFVVLLLAVAWLLWRGHDVPVWLTCVVTLLLAAFTLVCVVLLMLPLLRLLEMAVMMWTLVFA